MIVTNNESWDSVLKQVDTTTLNTFAQGNNVWRYLMTIFLIFQIVLNDSN